MSHPSAHDEDLDGSTDGLVLKPKPRRPFELSSPPPSAPSTPPLHLQPPEMTNPAHADGSETPSRTRSFLNLTSSTLFGIYQPTGYSAERENATPWGGATPWANNTPWGTGAQTPAEQSPISRQMSYDWPRNKIPDAFAKNGSAETRARRKSTMPAQQRAHQMPKRGFRGYLVPLIARTVTMFAIGVGYALLITHLHDRRGVAPVRVELDRSSWTYLVLWGTAGVLLGEALPWADQFWAASSDEDDYTAEEQQERQDRGLDGWMDVVRAIGAFVGVAFAIRKLPWQSTLQLSLTLALANPAIWYLIDRSPPGFVMSTIFSLGGTALTLVINPALVPSPSPAQLLRGLVARNGGARMNATAELGGEDLMLGIFSPESVGVATWIASVFFVSSLCFGNIGRRLAVRKA